MSIDLDEIRERAVSVSQGAYRVVFAEDFDALTAEVERLQQVQPKRDYYASLGAAQERAAVVEWLRAECGSPGHEERFCAYCNVRRNIAADIERGEHRREEEK